MKALNLGLCLEKPYQSLHSRYRGFILMNPGQTTNDLSRFIREEISNCFCKGKLLSENFKTLWEGRCGRSLPSNLLQTLQHKNCGICASQGYHSDIYNLPWLMYCPRHPLEPLTTYCPACKKQWQTNYALRNDCKICGRLKVSQLAINGAFEEFQTSESFEYLYSLIEPRKYWEIHNLHSGVPQQGMMQTVQFTSHYFPSILAALEPTQSDRLKTFKIPILACDNIKDKCVDKLIMKTPSVSKLIKMNYHNQEWEKVVEESCCKKMLTFLGNLSECGHTLRKTGLAKNRGGSPTCNYCIAYKTWIEFLGQDKQLLSSELNIVAYDIYHYYFAKQLDRPQPLRFIWAGNSSLEWYEQPELMILPESIQKAIYELELWTCFINILSLIKKILFATDGFGRTSKLNNANFKTLFPNFYIHTDSYGAINLVLPNFNPTFHID